MTSNECGVPPGSIAVARMEQHVDLLVRKLRFQAVFTRYDIAALFVRLLVRRGEIAFHIIHLGDHRPFAHGERIQRNTLEFAFQRLFFSDYDFLHPDLFLQACVPP